MSDALEMDAGLVDEGGALLTDIAAERALVGALLCKPALFDAIKDFVAGPDFSDAFLRRLFDTVSRAYGEGFALAQNDYLNALGGEATIIDGRTAKQFVASLMANSPPGATGDDLADLADAIFNCAERRAKNFEDAGAPIDADFRSKFHAVPWSNLDMPGAEHDWLIKGILTRGERSLCAGASQSGKSFFVLDMALAIARGVPFAGRRTKQGLVVYQAGEGRLGLKKRMRAYREHHGVAPDQELPFVLLPAAVNLYGNQSNVPDLIAEIDHWKSVYGKMKHDLELIVIDTLSAATPGANENASEDMSEVLARVENIAEHFKCHVMLVHHLNAAGAKPRGHSSLFANVENAIEITMTDRTVSGGFKPDGTEIQRKVREAKVTKQKDGEDGAKWGFVLRQVLLGRDADGDPITSCVIEEEHAQQDADDAMPRHTAHGMRLNNSENLFFNALLDAMNDAGVVPDKALELPSTITRVVDYAHVRALIGKRTLLEGMTEDERKKERGALKNRVKRARENLQRLKLVGVSDPWIWWTGRPVAGIARTQRAVDEAPQATITDEQRVPFNDENVDWIS